MYVPVDWSLLYVVCAEVPNPSPACVMRTPLLSQWDSVRGGSLAWCQSCWEQLNLLTLASLPNAPGFCWICWQYSNIPELDNVWMLLVNKTWRRFSVCIWDFPSTFLFLLKHNRTADVGRDLWRSHSPISWLKQDQLEHVCQICIQSYFKYLQKWRDHSVSGELVPKTNKQNKTKTKPNSFFLF